MKDEPKVIIDNEMRWYPQEFIPCEKCPAAVEVKNNGSYATSKGEPEISICPECGAEYIYYKNIPEELVFEKWDGKMGPEGE